MRNRIQLLTGMSLLLLLISSEKLLAQDLLKEVDPGIGTAHSRWFFYTPAAVPQGMAKLAPSTNGHYGNAQGWEAVGYDIRHNSLEGFVHFHEWQIGGISYMPTTGKLQVRPGTLEDPDGGYRSRFDRSTEVAEPGYYKVLLQDYGIRAELTATQRVGFQCYTFPKSDSAHIILDIGRVQGESGPVTDAEIHMIDDRHFAGYVKTYPRYVQIYDSAGQVNMYIYGEISKKASAVGAFTEKEILPNTRSVKGIGAGLYLDFQTKEGEQVEIRTGLSYTSEAHAQMNFEKEAAGLSFQKAKKKAQDDWQQKLSKIKVYSADAAAKRKFYTGLFHALLGRGVASDVDGSFPRADGSTGKLPAAPSGKIYNYINTDAIWGANWNLTQLWSMAYPNYFEDFIHTQLQLNRDKGWFGDGIANSQYVSGVGTNMVGLAIASAYQAGIRDYDVNEAFEAVRHNELGWRNRPVGSGKLDTKIFLEKHYVPMLEIENGQYITDDRGSVFSASHTLEYSFSAFAAAQFAKQLNRKADYDTLIGYSKSWKNLYNEELGMIQPRNTSGAFIDHYDPAAAWRGFQEGNGIQYSYYVPHDPKTMIELQGVDSFNHRLNSIFETAEKLGFGGGKTIDAFAGVQSQYNHGNQPCLYISWLFNFSGEPWLTQKWTRAICQQFYGTEPVHGYGYGQDEDQGQLGAWYVMASLGLFDVKGLTDAKPILEIGSPVFDRAVIQLQNGKSLEIETKNNSASNAYIQSASFNGKPLDRCWLYWEEIMKGGKLVFEMGPTANKNWGTTAPPSVQ